MPEQQPSPQPEPGPDSRPDWNEVSAQEIEQKLTAATDLAYELAGNVGTDTDQPRYRDTSELESIETALDVELKQLEHLVDKTREQLSDDPKPPEKPGAAAAVPDFMSEFLSEEPVTIVPEPRVMAPAEAGTPSSLRPEFAAAEVHPERRSQGVDSGAKVGLVGVGSLGRRDARKSQGSKPKADQPPPKPPRESWARKLEGPLYLMCNGAIQMLEQIDRPFARLGASTRRALSVTAIAAFCVCLLMFVLSMLFS